MSSFCLQTQVLSYFSSIISGRRASDHSSSQGLSENEHCWGLPFERKREEAKSLKFFFYLLLALISGSESSQTTSASSGGLRPRAGGFWGSSQVLRDHGSLPGGVWMVRRWNKGWLRPQASCPAKVSQRNCGCGSKKQNHFGVEFVSHGVSFLGSQSFGVLPSYYSVKFGHSSPLTFKRDPFAQSSNCFPQLYYP